MEVEKKIQDLLSEQLKGASYSFSNGYKLEVSKWGQQRKSYHLSVCKPNENVMQHVGVVEERHLDLFKECFGGTK